MIEKYLRNIVGNQNCSVKIFVTLAEGIASDEIEKIAKSAVSSDIMSILNGHMKRRNSS